MLNRIVRHPVTAFKAKAMTRGYSFGNLISTRPRTPVAGPELAGLLTFFVAGVIACEYSENLSTGLVTHYFGCISVPTWVLLHVRDYNGERAKDGAPAE